MTLGSWKDLLLVDDVAALGERSRDGEAAATAMVYV